MQKTGKEPIGFLKQNKDYTDRLTFDDMAEDMTMRICNMVDAMPIDDWFPVSSEIPVPRIQENSKVDKDLWRFERDAKQKVKEEYSGNVKDNEGKQIHSISGLSPMEISQLRQKFYEGEGDEINYYFDSKKDFLDSDGSISLKNYLVLKYCGFKDSDIYNHFGLKATQFKYFKSKLLKALPEDKMDEVAEQAYKDWEAGHPKVGQNLYSLGVK